MYDDVGCVDLLPYKYYKELERFGIMAMPFNPIKPFVSTAWNNRDHRKVVVIDGHTAYTGGLNLSDEYINKVERSVRQMKDMEPFCHISIMKMPLKERDLYNLMPIIHQIMRLLEKMYI